VIKEKELKEALRFVEQCSSAVVLGHENPDGDAVGSSLGLALMLEDKGYRVTVSFPEPLRIPHRYLFLPGAEKLQTPEGISDCEILFAVDCANPDRLDLFRDFIPKCRAVINIDHHPDNTMFGTVNLVDHEAAATAEIIYAVGPQIGLRISKDAALCLYTGIVTDTGRFQFSNTREETLRIASEIVHMGVDPSYVYENVYQSDSLEYVRLLGKVLSEAVFEKESGLIYAVVTRADLDEFGVNMEETEDLIDALRTLKGHRIAAIFKELKDGRIRVSLRSRNDVDIGSVARKLGGGGHRVAAGYVSSKSTIEDALLELKGAIGVD